MERNYYDDSQIKLVAIKTSDNQRIHANYATKADGPFYCPETYEELIVRKCIEKKDHFAYKSKISPTGSKESPLHSKCKKELLSILNKAYPNGNWDMERPFNENKIKGYSKVVPDLSGRINPSNNESKGKAIIIEVQASTLSIKKIMHRTEQYSKRNAFILWIVPLEEKLGLDNFRPRLFERFLHTMYYGKVYYWCIGDGSVLTPVHFDTTDRYIDESNWYDSDGTYRTEGGYYKTYLRVKKPNYGTPVDLLKDFKIDSRNAFELENDDLSIPKCKIFVDNQEKWW